jgi:hypothetical protein
VFFSQSLPSLGQDVAEKADGCSVARDGLWDNLFRLIPVKRVVKTIICARGHYRLKRLQAGPILDARPDSGFPAG